jgi:hypothetical protein
MWASDDLDAVGRRVAALLTDEKARAAVAAEQQRRAYAECTIEQCGAKYDALYQRLAAR